MKPHKLILGLAVVLVMNGMPTVTETGGRDDSALASGSVRRVYYFIAVHNEPFHFPGGRARIAESFEILRGMVASATAKCIKLTLMFAPQWADYIVADPARLAEVRGWKAAGHEIAAHHHSIYHGNWDGYTDYPQATAVGERLRRVKVPEPYLGTLADFMAKLYRLDPTVVSGCANDEADKAELLPGITCDTCSGFANHGDVGVRESDAASPNKCRNEFITVGTWQGVKRYWLAHYQITTPERTEAAKRTLAAMASAVYGVVLHSSAREAVELEKLLTFLSELDPTGSGSMTVREIVESGILPERELPQHLLDEKPPAPRR